MRGKRSSRPRGGARGRSSNDGRRPKSRRTGGEKSNFSNSRIKKQVEGRSSGSEEENVTEIDSEHLSSQLSSDGENTEAARSQVKPYNVLLQSLGAGTHGEEPERKKRKLHQVKDSKDENTTEEDMDIVMESEDSTNLEIDELIDPEDPDDIREGIHSRFQFKSWADVIRP